MPTMAKRRIIPEKGEVTAAQVRALREHLGLSLEDLAAKVGVKPSTIYSWETPSQKRRPSESHAILLRLVEDGDL